MSNIVEMQGTYLIRNYSQAESSTPCGKHKSWTRKRHDYLLLSHQVLNQKGGRGPPEEPIFLRKTLRCAPHAELHEGTIKVAKIFPMETHSNKNITPPLIRACKNSYSFNLGLNIFSGIPHLTHWRHRSV